jgi:hypothetical protein
VSAATWVGFADEMRLGLMGQVRRVWAPRGIKVVQRLQFVRQWRYLALVVHPERGALVWTWIADMKGETVAEGVKAWKNAGVEAVVWDRARSHRSAVVKGTSVRLVEQPPYAPEVQPAERIFEELRRAVEGVVYETLEAKVAAVERELRTLAADPARVRRLTGWSWIKAAYQSLPENAA